MDIKELSKDLRSKLKTNDLDRRTLLYVLRKIEGEDNMKDEYHLKDIKPIHQFDLSEYEKIYKIEFYLAPMIELNERYGGLPASLDTLFYFDDDRDNFYILDGDNDINNMFSEEDIDDKIVPSLYSDYPLYFSLLLSLFKEEDYEDLKDVIIEVAGYRDDEDNTWTGSFLEFKELAEKGFGIKPPHNYDT